MIYELRFHALALKEWKKLDRELQLQFQKILKRRLEDPHVMSAKSSGRLKDCYKIKLRQSGYRLVYHVHDAKLIVLIVVIGKRDKNKVYSSC